LGNSAGIIFGHIIHEYYSGIFLMNIPEEYP